MNLHRVQFVVVGGGPAGLAAARTMATRQGQVVLLDRRPDPGGRRLWSSPNGHATYGELTPEVAFFGGTLVWGIFADGVLACERAGRSFLVQAERIVLATGARQTLPAFPGWEHPAVWSLHRLLARIDAGQVRGVCLAAYVGTAKGAAAMDAAKQAGATVVRLIGPCGPNGGEVDLRPVLAQRGPSGLRVHWADRAQQFALETETDALVVAAGESQRNELARQAGCCLAFDETIGDWTVAVGDAFDTSLPYIFAVPAGRTPAAEIAAGSIAGFSAMHSLFPHAETASRRELVELRRIWSEAIAADEADRGAGAGPVWFAPPDVICPCEHVTADRAQSLGQGLAEANQWKRATRIGMGTCQGRYCRRVAAAFLAVQTGKSLAELPSPSCRPPIWPVRLDSAAAIRQAFRLGVGAEGR